MAIPGRLPCLEVDWRPAELPAALPLIPGGLPKLLPLLLTVPLHLLLPLPPQQEPSLDLQWHLPPVLHPLRALAVAVLPRRACLAPVISPLLNLAALERALPLRLRGGLERPQRLPVPPGPLDPL